MKKFKFSCAPEVFDGKGSFEKLGEIAKNLNGSCAFVAIDESLARKTDIKEKTIKILESSGIRPVVYDKVLPEPTTDMGNECAEIARKNNCDITIGIGGGSTLDTAKAVAVLLKNPGRVEDYQGADKVKKPSVCKIMVPTTAGTGSEVTLTAVFIRAYEKQKAGINSSYLFPEAAILDPVLSLSLPKGPTASTGMDAFCHAIESYLSKQANFFTRPISMAAMKLIWKNLPVAFEKPENIQARQDMLHASFLAGVGLVNAGVTAVHSLSYPLGGLFGIGHGIGNALLLPYVLQSTLPYTQTEIEDIATELTGKKIDAQSFIDTLKEFEKSLSIPSKLSEVNIPQSAIMQLVEGAMQVKVPLGNHPTPITDQDIIKIYQSAF